MPNRRKTPAELEASGSLKKNPSRVRITPTPKGELGSPPKHLTPEVRATWLELVRSIAEGVLTRADRFQVEIAATLMHKFRTGGLTKDGISAAQLSQLHSALGKLGASPADRNKVSQPVPKADETLAEFD